MKTRYRALLRLIMDPVVWKLAATFGIAESTAVLEMRESKPHHAMTRTMMFLRRAGKRS